MANKNPYKRGGMFEGASSLIFEKAKRLRKNMTNTQNVLWMYLRKGVNGYKFRRQHPIGNYITDFFSYKAKLIIEIDGSIHNNEEVRKNDLIRQSDLEKLGYTILRFANIDVDKNVDFVISEIIKSINNIIKNKTPKIGV